MTMCKLNAADGSNIPENAHGDTNEIRNIAV